MTQQLTPTHKTCRKCNEAKPVDQFYKNKRAKDGFESACKKCESAASREWYEANRERAGEKSRAWYEANRERKRENQRAWRKANLERVRDINRAWDEANRDRERHRENARAWYKANRERSRENKRRRRARKAHTVPQRWTVDHNLGDPLACWWCGRGLLGTTTHIDHVMPIKLGGPAHPNNEVTTCHTCNLRKRDSHPLVWIAQLTSE